MGQYVFMINQIVFQQGCNKKGSLQCTCPWKHCGRAQGPWYVHRHEACQLPAKEIQRTVKYLDYGRKNGAVMGSDMAGDEIKQFFHIHVDSRMEIQSKELVLEFFPDDCLQHLHFGVLF